MRRGEGDTRSGRLISAPEVACWAYCPEQWRLHYGLGKTPPKANRKVMAAGERHHAVNERVERAATGVAKAGNRLAVVTLAILGLLAALLLAWIWRQ